MGRADEDIAERFGCVLKSDEANCMIPSGVLCRLLIQALTLHSGSVRLEVHRMIELIVFAVNDWVADVRRRGGSVRGGAMGGSVGDLLQRCESALPPPGTGRNDGGRELAEVRRDLRSLRREVAGLVERVPTGSLRFA